MGESILSSPTRILIVPSSVTPDDIYAEGATVNGVEAWAKKGIAGRGVLIDYHWWAQKNNKDYDRLTSHGVTLDDIKTIMKECKIELRKGDIFIMRTGMWCLAPAIDSSLTLYRMDASLQQAGQASKGGL